MATLRGLLERPPATAPVRHRPLYVGSPETVARKTAASLQALGATRFDLKYGVPGLTRDQMMTGTGLYGRHVIPRVRELPA